MLGIKANLTLLLQKGKTGHLLASGMEEHCTVQVQRPNTLLVKEATSTPQVGLGQEAEDAHIRKSG